MLQLVTGLAGTGQTAYLVAEMRRLTQRNRPVIYLVPEQFSFEAEKMLLRELGQRQSSCVEVLSFTRLCDSIFRQYGGISGIELGRQAKILLMSVAVSQLRDEFKAYRQSAANTAFLETLLGAVSEFQAAAVPPERLAAFATECDKPLADKLSDIAAVYTAWESLAEQGYRDEGGAPARACAYLENNDFFAGKTVFVDRFVNFTAAESELLGHAIAQADDIVFAFTADGLVDKNRGNGVFSAAIAEMNRLMRQAQQSGVAVAEPVLLTEPVRYRNPWLRELSRRFFRPGEQPVSPEGDFMYEPPALFAADDLHAEVCFVAAEIARLVRDDGLRYREIAVVARDPAPYQSALEAVFPLYDIPYFAGWHADIGGNPLLSAVLSALNAVGSGFDTSEVLLFAKNPLLGLAPEAAAALDNYCYLWGIRGGQWHSDFRNSPRGLSDKKDDGDAAALAGINAARQAVAGPLLRLRDNLKEPDGRSFAAAIFALLEEIGAVDNLHGYARGLGAGEASFLAESAQIWDELVAVLDVFGAVLGGQVTKRKHLIELFRLAIDAVEISFLPQTLDQVLVGAADRIRPAEVRAVFIVGANEGVFPAQPDESGVFSDSERRKMIDAGIGLSSTVLERAALENTFAYYAVTLPSERLFVSWHKTQKGGELLPSSIVTGLRELCSGESAPDKLDGIAGSRTAFAALAARLNEDTPLAATLREGFAGTPELERLHRASMPTSRAIREKSVAQSLFGRQLRLSPTKIEQYYKCPFSYFAGQGLRLRARRRAEFDPITSGEVLHHVMQSFLQRHSAETLHEIPERQMQDEIAATIREFLALRVEDAEALPTRQKYLFERLSGLLARVIRRLGEEFAQSLFRPVAFELSIGGDVEPLALETPSGSTVLVEGKIDRLDVMEKNGKRWVRVIDYKSGEKKFALNEVFYGLNLQMLLYLFTVAQNGTGALEGAIPAGVLYMPVKEKFQTAGRDASDAEVAAARGKAWCMNGLLLEDEEVLRGMERECAGVYIPVKMGKNGEPSAKSSLATAAEMGRLAQKVRGLVADMASALGEGAIAACPALNDGRQPCEYCDYKTVCGFETGDAVREIAGIDRDAFFKALEEEGQTDG